MRREDPIIRFTYRPTYDHLAIQVHQDRQIAENRSGERIAAPNQPSMACDRRDAEEGARPVALLVLSERPIPSRNRRMNVQRPMQANDTSWPASDRSPAEVHQTSVCSAISSGSSRPFSKIETVRRKQAGHAIDRSPVRARWREPVRAKTIVLACPLLMATVTG